MHQDTPPDDSGEPDPRIRVWQSLISDENRDLLEAAGGVRSPGPREIATLRKRWPADLVRAALELVDARRRGHDKLAPWGRPWVGDRQGVEQASSARVARHKARRFAGFGGRQVVDLCCGIGGDTMALAEVGAVTAIDRDPLRAWMASTNAGCPVRVADVDGLAIEADAMHLDPARRDIEGTRSWNFEHIEPSPESIRRLLENTPHACVKLGPGVEHEDAVSLARAAWELEFIAEHGTPVQALLWHGALAHHPGQVTATRLPEDVSVTGDPRVLGAFPVGDPGRSIVLLEPVLERAGIARGIPELADLRELAPGLGVFTCDEVPASSWVTGYPIEATLPWRPERVRAWLADHDAGPVVVKTRGKAADPEVERRRLSGKGSSSWTVFVLRLGRKKVAVVTRPPGGDGTR